MPSKTVAADSEEELGSLRLSPLTQVLRTRFTISAEAEGVVTTAVVENSAAGQKGLKPGNVLRTINQAPARAPDDVSKQIAAVKSGP
jgi:serine protease Do